MHQFMSFIPFNDAIASCNFEMSMTSAMYMYQGHVDVFISIKLSEGVIREVKTILKFTIILPKTLEVSATVDVVSSVDIKGWLTEKSWTWATGLGTLEYRTATSAPYILEVVDVTAPAGIIASIVENEGKSECPEDQEALCVQFWTVTVNPEVSCPPPPVLSPLFSVFFVFLFLTKI